MTEAERMDLSRYGLKIFRALYCPHSNCQNCHFYDSFCRLKEQIARMEDDGDVRKRTCAP